ncbi:choice-of-anchor A family protein [Streptomyces sp. NPDC057654]|uniref:choice-of-anchor A family protein n=1 Tax=Streptomyces sp. NPDC057654 TaxID=3346196 RepID=UPI00369C82AC
MKKAGLTGVLAGAVGVLMVCLFASGSVAEPLPEGPGPELTAAAECYAYEHGGPREPTGTAANLGDATVFTGDGESRLQVFDVGFDLMGWDGGDQGVAFDGIPEDATVLVNVTGPARTISSSTGDLPDGLHERLLWNFPDAAQVTIQGSAPFQGSVLIGRPESVTTVSAPGMNGRLFTAGSLTPESMSESTPVAEADWYPFNGELPECPGEHPSPTPTHTLSTTRPTASPSDTPSGSPTESPSESASEPPSEIPSASSPSASPSKSPSARPSASPSQSPSESRSASPSASASESRPAHVPAPGPGPGSHGTAGGSEPLAHSGPAMADTMLVGASVAALGAGVSLVFLFRSRERRS